MKPYTQLSILTVFLASCTVVLAGDLDSPADLSDSGSAMYTIEDIYNRLDTGAPAPAPSGGFTEPTSGPASTGHTLTDVYNKIPSCIPNSSASPIFSDNGDGTVTDNRTCLVWLKDASCVGTNPWADVDTSTEVVTLIDAATCDDYTSGTFDDWRLPTVQELQSLVHYGYFNPAMSNTVGDAKWTTDGDAFSGVQTGSYWSSTTYADGTGYAWRVYLYGGYVYSVGKAYSYYVWPVRGGQ